MTTIFSKQETVNFLLVFFSPIKFALLAALVTIGYHCQHVQFYKIFFTLRNHSCQDCMVNFLLKARFLTEMVNCHPNQFWMNLHRDKTGDNALDKFPHLLKMLRILLLVSDCKLRYRAMKDKQILDKNTSLGSGYSLLLRFPARFPLLPWFPSKVPPASPPPPPLVPL